MSQPLKADVRWIRRRRLASVTDGGAMRDEQPLWAFSSQVPRPVWLIRRLCWVLAAWTLLLPALLAGMAAVLRFDISDFTGWQSIVRLVGAAALLVLAAQPVRHIAWFGWLFLVPPLYLVVLPRWMLLLVPLFAPLFFAHYRWLIRTGTMTWFRRDREIQRVFGG